MNTPTPRTDAEECELHMNFVGASMRKCRDGGWVDSDFARTLERELAAEKARADHNAVTKADIDRVWSNQTLELRAQLAAAHEDTKRLDWLESQGKPETFEDAPHATVWSIIGDMGSSDLRAAIDAARKGQP